jgi:tetratricopeptide (TPR) repeat protein
MIAMLAAGQYEEGRSLFQEWLTLQLNEGVVPFIGQELYNSAISHDGLHTMNTLLLESSRRLIEARMLMTMHSLIIQVRELGNTAIASQMMTMLLTSLDVKERPDVSLYAIEQLRRLNDKRADRLLDQVMELPSVAQIPNLWRFASTLAAESGRKRLAVDRLEKAIQLDFETRPSVINLETVRSDYTSLLTEYDELITAAMTLEITPASDLFARVIKAADQWRSLDDDDTAACQMASRLLSKLQQTELAWDYLATPLAENSGESTPWIALARSLGEEKLVELAEMAWTRAFEFEPTNPDILLEHARLLQTAGRVGDARNLLTHVVSGEWQPRFSRTKSEARDLLSTLQRR